MNTQVSNAKSDIYDMNCKNLQPWSKKHSNAINADLTDKPAFVRREKNSVIVLEKAKHAIQRPGTADRRYHNLYSELRKQEGRKIMSGIASKANLSGAASLAALASAQNSRYQNSDCYIDLPNSPLIESKNTTQRMAALQQAADKEKDEQLEFTLAKPFDTVKDESDEQDTDESIA